MNFISRLFNNYIIGKNLNNDARYKKGVLLSKKEMAKTPTRTEVINYIISYLNKEVTYLEIGVRNPNDNYFHINAKTKFSVDPGIEFEENPVDFKMTSDVFFEKLTSGKILKKDIKFDVIFIDGLHLAEQVDRDIKNAFNYLSNGGFIILHDCNPPSEWHAREDYYFNYTPAKGKWNGTTWKAFLKWRIKLHSSSCCIDSDWGIGILTNHHHSFKGKKLILNDFFEFHTFSKNRKELLNLISFDKFKELLNSTNK